MNLETKLRKAEIEDRHEIWAIIQQSIERRKQDGSTQWQNGYPNMGTVESDIAKGFGQEFPYKRRELKYLLVQNFVNEVP